MIKINPTTEKVEQFPFYFMCWESGVESLRSTS